VTAGYFDTVDKKGKSWKEIWENQTNIPTDMSAEDVPDLYKETSAFSWTLKVYASKLFTSTIADAVGTVNLVSHWLNRVLQSTNPLIKYAEFEDGAEVWLLLSCPITMVGFNNWEYAFTFVLGADNKYESVTADHKNSWNVSYGLKHNLYRKTNFGNLLIDMNVAKIDPDILGAVR
ncbi:hypothetical protein CL622_01665, partial [archaeon]|nr:hypothetical protein [archaeon]